MSRFPTELMELLLDDLRKSDRDRYLCLLLMPEQSRGFLAGLFAFNSELAQIRERVSDPAAGEVSFQGYKSIKILQPEADGVVRSNEGKVPVTIALEPALQQGHRVALHIDGKAVQGAFDGLAIELSGIERGTHSVRASVSDADGKLLIEAPAVSFTLRQTGLFDSVANTPGLPIAKPVARPRPGGR